MRLAGADRGDQDLISGGSCKIQRHLKCFRTGRPLPEVVKSDSFIYISVDESHLNGTV